MTISIGNRTISDDRCFIIAEAGVNHNGSLDIAKELVDVAAESGSDAVKFQTFKSEKLVTSYAKQAEYQARNIGKEQSQYEMLKKLELPYEYFKELSKYCDKKGIIFMSTPHSCNEDVDLVSEISSAIKVGSGDLTNIPLLKYIAAKQLPIILSTGMSTVEDIEDALRAIKPTNNKVILLHCTSNYPTPLNEVNLKAMISMKNKFSLPVGYSDHTIGIYVSVASVAMGAVIVEKHFTLDKNMEGPDHKASLDSHELKEMVSEIRRTSERLRKGETGENIVNGLNMKEILGDGIKRPMPSEINTMEIARKSIVASGDIPENTMIKDSMIAMKRPGTGLKPKFYLDVIGKKTKKAIKKDGFITFDDLL